LKSGRLFPPTPIFQSRRDLTSLRKRLIGIIPVAYPDAVDSDQLQHPTTRCYIANDLCGLKRSARIPIS
jgi:hypothetical protein